MGGALFSPPSGRAGGGSRWLWPSPQLGPARGAEAGGYWQSMNVSNRCASCSGADVSSMRGAEPCALPGGEHRPCSPLATLRSPAPSPGPRDPLLPRGS